MPDTTRAPWQSRLHEVIFEADTPGGKAFDLALLLCIMLSVAAIYSRRTEPERRRTLLLPFFPLVPSIALSLDIALLLNTPTLQLLAFSIWLLVGVIFYLSYARAHQMEAQEGVLTFGPDPHRAKTDDVYRILVPLSTGLERPFNLRVPNRL